MPSFRVLFHPDAVIDAREARLWYARVDAALGDAFADELDNAIGRIAETPLTWVHAANDQRYLLHRFPYSIVYRLRGEEIHVLAVAHLRRKPGYWRDR